MTNAAQSMFRCGWGMALIAVLGLAEPAPTWAQAAGPVEQIVQARPPTDWTSGEFLGVGYAIPPGWQKVQGDDESFIYFGGDMETRTGPAFGVRLIEDVAEFLDAAPGEPRPVQFDGGRRFDRLAATQTPEGVTVQGDLIVSAEPYWQGKFLAITLLAYNGALAEHASTFEQLLAAITVPPAGEVPRQSFLDGGFRIAVPSSDWRLVEGDKTVKFDRRRVMGFVRISRLPANTGRGYLNGWTVPSSVAGRPVNMLGQPALLYEWDERKSDYDDGSDDPQTTRVYVFESCAAGPETLAIELSGLPSFYASDELNDLLDQIEVDAGTGPCGPDNLPAGAVAGTSGERPDGRAAFGSSAGASVQAQTAEPTEGTALDGLVSYVAPPGWFAMSATDSVTLLHPDGRGFVTVARGSGVLAPEGVVALIPPDRLGSFFAGHGKDWTELGWPPVSAEFLDRGQPAEGWHFVRIARDCLPNQEPVAIHYAGIDRFRNGETLKELLGGLTFHWPDGMEECLVKDAGYGQSTPGPAAVPEPVPEPVPAPSAAMPLSDRSTPSDPPQPVRQSGAIAPPVSMQEIPAAPVARVDPPLVPPPPPVVAEPVPQPEPDSFTEGEGGYTLYQNARYGTFISYPASYYSPEPPPGNGDGRSFVSADGASRFFVFAQYDAFDLTQAEMMKRDEAAGGYDDVTYRASGEGWFVLSGHIGSNVFYRKVIRDPSGLIQVFQIVYPGSLQQAFDPVVTFMANSFGPGTSQSSGDDRASDPVADNDVAKPQPVRADRLMTPARNTDLRKALMDAARQPIQAEIGRKVIFVVSVLRTDGQWAYLQAVPHNPDGSKIDWARTPFAREMNQGVMSDVAMVLLRKLGGEWTVVEHVFGPSDVYWVSWADAYGLDQALFMP